MIATIHLLVGIWRGVLMLPDAGLPFNFDISLQKGNYIMTIHNGEERIVVDEIKTKDDSLYIRLPVFDSEFRVKVTDSSMNGYWLDHSRKNYAPVGFQANSGNSSRFEVNGPPSVNVSGRWKATLYSGTADSSEAIGVFNQSGSRVTGTFLASGGDHRWLEGSVSNDTLWLSTFDGSHCWLYRAVMKDGVLYGTYWSGIHHKSYWYAIKNDSVNLADPSAIASVNGSLQFILPDADSNLVSFPDDYANKPVIIQILGSWCPNCMDESIFLSNFYRTKTNDLEIIGIAFERATDFPTASANIKRMKRRLGINYPVLFGGKASRDSVMKVLPALVKFSSYPTTIYINRQGVVKKVYTGFSGPATGAEYDRFVLDFYKTVKTMD